MLDIEIEVVSASKRIKGKKERQQMSLQQEREDVLDGCMRR